MHSRKVLVLASEPMLAAFLGMLLELDTYEPVFAEPGERAEDALTRVRPVLVIIIDATLDAAASDLFYARATRTGAKVILFGTADGLDRARALSAERRVPCFEMPVDRATLGRAIADATRDVARSRATGDRRAVRAYDGPDGTLLFTDEIGQVWKVYDRRGSERRAHPSDAVETLYRVFVSESGDERRYHPPRRQSLETSVEALARQLAEATVPENADD